MSTATLASDTVGAEPTRLPSWVPRILVRAAAGTLRQPTRWPFSSRPSAHGRHAPAPVAQPVAAGPSAVRQPAAAHPIARPIAAPIAAPIADPTPTAGAVAPTAQIAPTAAAAPAGLSAATGSIDTMAAHSQSMGTRSYALEQGVTLRQMVCDVLLVAMWGALIPGLMWLGAAAGF